MANASNRHVSDCGRKLEHLEETHTDTERKSRLRTDLSHSNPAQYERNRRFRHLGRNCTGMSALESQNGILCWSQEGSYDPQAGMPVELCPWCTCLAKEPMVRSYHLWAYG